MILQPVIFSEAAARRAGVKITAENPETGRRQRFT
jgi:hypothetical protein